MGAGLPAIQTPRCISYTEVMLSQASQLPHKPAPTWVSGVFRPGTDPSASSAGWPMRSIGC
ncbi:hypothetical protein FJD34_05640 [Pseudomonas brenneri]|uniref:Uncharacterized protein n=1 Tax=Pseudomonas brenneri TaxID=129817 RepID=A0A5B2UTQ0_9PSED|nr:hypothetical protein F1720_12665 [Pseudomonas brenneri]TWR81338.1 hypothetical protein FJD34_05640 [Pseudomonas brenneri]